MRGQQRQDPASQQGTHPQRLCMHVCVHVHQVAPCNPQDARRRTHAPNQLQRQLQSNVLSSLRRSLACNCLHTCVNLPRLWNGQWSCRFLQPGNSHIIYSLQRAHPSPIDRSPALFNIFGGLLSTNTCSVASSRLLKNRWLTVSGIPDNVP